MRGAYIGLIRIGSILGAVVLYLATAYSQEGPTRRNLADLLEPPAVAPGLVRDPTESANKVVADGPRRLQGTVIRPETGVQHEDLDSAWTEYNAIIAKADAVALASLKAVFDAAADEGDLDKATRCQATLDEFQLRGTFISAALPASEAKEIASLLKAAHDGLGKRYDALVSRLTQDRLIADAKAARDEWRALQVDAKSAANAPVAANRGQADTGRPEPTNASGTKKDADRDWLGVWVVESPEDQTPAVLVIRPDGTFQMSRRSGTWRTRDSSMLSYSLDDERKGELVQTRNGYVLRESGRPGNPNPSALAAMKVTAHNSAKVLDIDSRAGWTPVLAVEKGDQVRVVALGKWNILPGAPPKDWLCDADGGGTRQSAGEGRGFPLATAREGMLVGSLNGTVAPLGKNARFVAHGQGVLNAICNDAPQFRGDNIGMLTVILWKENAQPAVGTDNRSPMPGRNSGSDPASPPTAAKVIMAALRKSQQPETGPSDAERSLHTAYNNMWEQYEAEVRDVRDSLVEVLSQQFEKATEAGNLDLADVLEKEKRALVETGVCDWPLGTKEEQAWRKQRPTVPIDKEVSAAVKAAVAGTKTALKRLNTGYEVLVVEYTKAKNTARAKELRAEHAALMKQPESGERPSTSASPTSGSGVKDKNLLLLIKDVETYRKHWREYPGGSYFYDHKTNVINAEKIVEVGDFTADIPWQEVAFDIAVERVHFNRFSLIINGKPFQIGPAFNNAQNGVPVRVVYAPAEQMARVFVGNAVAAETNIFDQGWADSLRCEMRGSTGYPTKIRLSNVSIRMPER